MATRRGGRRSRRGGGQRRHHHSDALPLLLPPLPPSPSAESRPTAVSRPANTSIRRRRREGAAPQAADDASMLHMCSARSWPQHPHDACTRTDECAFIPTVCFVPWGDSRGFSETHISPANFILPMFVHDGASRRLASPPAYACGLYARSPAPFRRCLVADPAAT